MLCIATLCPPTHPSEQQSLWLKTICLSFPILPTLPCDFPLFPKLKMKLNEQHSESVSDTLKELQVVLDSIKNNNFHGASESWKKLWNHCIHSQWDFCRRRKPNLCALSQQLFLTQSRNFPICLVCHWDLFFHFNTGSTSILSCHKKMASCALLFKNNAFYLFKWTKIITNEDNVYNHTSAGGICCNYMQL
jgi:hypothetical protein